MQIISTDAAEVLLPGLEESSGALVSAIAILLLTATLLLALIHVMKKAWSFMRERTVDMGKYRQYQLDTLVADGIVEKVESALYNNTITRGEANEIYTKFGALLPDLLPRPKPKQRIKKLKKDIKERLRSTAYSPVPLPKEPPPIIKVRETEPVMPMNRLGELLMGTAKT